MLFLEFFSVDVLLCYHALSYHFRYKYLDSSIPFIEITFEKPREQLWREKNSKIGGLGVGLTGGV